MTVLVVLSKKRKMGDDHRSLLLANDAGPWIGTLLQQLARYLFDLIERRVAQMTLVTVQRHTVDGNHILTAQYVQSNERCAHRLFESWAKIRLEMSHSIVKANIVIAGHHNSLHFPWNGKKFMKTIDCGQKFIVLCVLVSNRTIKNVCIEVWTKVNWLKDWLYRLFVLRQKNRLKRTRRLVQSVIRPNEM